MGKFGGLEVEGKGKGIYGELKGKYGENLLKAALLEIYGILSSNLTPEEKLEKMGKYTEEIPALNDFFGMGPDEIENVLPEGLTPEHLMLADGPHACESGREPEYTRTNRIVAVVNPGEQGISKDHEPGDYIPLSHVSRRYTKPGILERLLEHPEASGLIEKGRTRGYRVRKEDVEKLRRIAKKLLNQQPEANPPAMPDEREHKPVVSRPVAKEEVLSVEDILEKYGEKGVTMAKIAKYKKILGNPVTGTNGKEGYLLFKVLEFVEKVQAETI